LYDYLYYYLYNYDRSMEEW